jgi:hypothetical protein
VALGAWSLTRHAVADALDLRVAVEKLDALAIK